MIIVYVWPCEQPSVTTEEIKSSVEMYCGGEWKVFDSMSPDVSDPVRDAIYWFYANGLDDNDGSARVLFYGTEENVRAIEKGIDAPWARTVADVKWFQCCPIGVSVAREIVWEFCEDNWDNRTSMR